MTSTCIARSPFVEGAFATLRPASEPVLTEAVDPVAELPAVVTVAVAVEATEAVAPTIAVDTVEAVVEVIEPVTVVPAQSRTERQMEQELAACLVVHGWQVTRKFTTASGTRIDMVATRPNHFPLVIECKLRLELGIDPTPRCCFAHHPGGGGGSAESRNRPWDCHLRR